MVALLAEDRVDDLDEESESPRGMVDEDRGVPDLVTIMGRMQRNPGFIPGWAWGGGQDMLQYDDPDSNDYNAGG